MILHDAVLSVTGSFEETERILRLFQEYCEDHWFRGEEGDDPDDPYVLGYNDAVFNIQTEAGIGLRYVAYGDRDEGHGIGAD
jgi:hypothetical protein